MDDVKGDELPAVTDPPASAAPVPVPVALNGTLRTSSGRTTSPREAPLDLNYLKGERDRLYTELEEVERERAGPSAEVEAVPGWSQWRNKLRLLVQAPNTSKSAFIFYVISSLMVLSMIVLMIITSKPQFRLPGGANAKAATFWAAFAVQVWFLLEMLLDWVTMNGWSEFFTFFSLLDVITVIPFWVAVPVVLGTRGLPADSSIFEAFTVIRVLRLLRLVKTGRNSRMAVLLQALKGSRSGIAALAIVFPLVMIFFGTAVFYAEAASCYVDPTTGFYIYDDPSLGVSKFQSIEIALWFMVVTLTTTGFGDIVPLTPQGRAITSIAMLTALFVLAMPMTLITSSYARVLEGYRALTEKVNGLEMEIRKVELKIADLEGKRYIDPFRKRKIMDRVRGLKQKLLGQADHEVEKGTGKELVDAETLKEEQGEAQQGMSEQERLEKIEDMLGRLAETMRRIEARLG